MERMFVAFPGVCSSSALRAAPPVAPPATLLPRMGGELNPTWQAPLGERRITNTR